MTTGGARFELTKLLTCAALEPGLDGVLLLDLRLPLLLAAAERFAQLLGRNARFVVLASHEHDDDLWISYRSCSDDTAMTFVPVRGRLLTDEPLVVVIPDLARLSLAGARAAVATMGSPTVLLERHGVSARVSNTLHWLASCATEDVGRVSPHLLDRFTARFPAGRMVDPREPATRVLDFLDDEREPDSRIPPSPPSWSRAFAASALVPAVSKAASERASTLHPAAVGARRPLALVRLARAFARLEEADEVTVGHVDSAALFTGLTMPSKPGAPRPAAPETEEAPPSQATRHTTPQAPTVTRPGTASPETNDHDAMPTPVLAGQPAEPLGPAQVSVARDPYPEDTAEPELEATPLVLPWQRRGGTPSDRGEVIGTEPTNRLADIAWVATLREAAKYQRIRGRGTHGNGSLVLSAADLRRYRRVPAAEHLLVLVLDHTCHRDWDWVPALAEHLRLAYTRRSAVCLIEVGAPHAENSLRAERTVVRSLLDPRVAAALERAPGTATPLAHGLELARAALCHALQHGRTPVSEASLVVVTDGLGNVPLEASLRGVVGQPVRGEGIDDALAVGRAIAELDRVRPVVVLPPRPPHPDVPVDLARSIGSACLVVAGDRP